MCKSDNKNSAHTNPYILQYFNKTPSRITHTHEYFCNHSTKLHDKPHTWGKLRLGISHRCIQGLTSNVWYPSYWAALRILVFWHISPCRLINNWRRFRGPWWFCLDNQAVLQDTFDLSRYQLRTIKWYRSFVLSRHRSITRLFHGFYNV
jgi:hypothetical protein